VVHVISPPDAQGTLSSTVERDSGGIGTPHYNARGDTTELLRVVLADMISGNTHALKKCSKNQGIAKKCILPNVM
jgi:hypothetical protein